MQLFIIRHGVAEPKGNRRHDPARALTRAGRKELAQVNRALKVLGVRFDNVYTSPWTRAVQTVEELEGLFTSEPIVTEELTRTPRNKLLRTLEGDRVAVVGHEPWLTQLISYCVSGSTEGARRYTLEKAGVAQLVGNGRAGRFKLVALSSPSQLTHVRR